MPWSFARFVLATAQSRANMKNGSFCDLSFKLLEIVMANFSLSSGLLRVVGLTLLALVAPLALGQTNNPPASYPFGQSQAIPGRYIVVFKNTVSNPAAETANVLLGSGAQLHHTYDSALKGFAATIPDAALNGIRNHPSVSYVEQDQTVNLRAVISPQLSDTWGLDRIDQRDLPLNTLYYFSGMGSGVTAFIIDTGIRADHVDFSDRMLRGNNFIADTNGSNDCNGHGTHVAGTVGGSTWGVAKGVSLVPVRVLDCTGSGSWSGVIAGINWVAASTLRPAVANMSLGGGASSAADAAVAGAVNAGVVMVVAAGNSNADACRYSPAREPSAITVGATTSTDSRASYSNIGKCVDLFAPGSSITSAWYTSITANNTISGTSMASPHVTGVAALTLGANPTATPAAVAATLLANATLNHLSSIGSGSPNLLLSTIGATDVLPPPAPVAFKSMIGSATKTTGGNWAASAIVTVRNLNTTATVANATVSATFSPGGNSSCVTNSSGSCTLSSGSIKANAASTTLTGNDISGSFMVYDASQNSVSQIVIRKP